MYEVWTSHTCRNSLQVVIILAVLWSASSDLHLHVVDPELMNCKHDAYGWVM
jgi:hypothetical protein